jgi:hypothetical protein
MLVPAATAYSLYGSNNEGIVALHGNAPLNKVFLVASNKGICNTGSLFSILEFTSSITSDQFVVLSMFASWTCPSTYTLKNGTCTMTTDSLLYTEVNMLLLETITETLILV